MFGSKLGHVWGKLRHFCGQVQGQLGTKSIDNVKQLKSIENSQSIDKYHLFMLCVEYLNLEKNIDQIV